MADPIATVAGPPGVRPGVGHQAAPALVVTAPVSGRAGLRPDHPADAGPGVADRELSWLDYVERVLSQAEDRSWSLPERVRFLALACRHLDRFLQVRMAGIQAPAARLATIRATAARLRARQACVFADDLRPALAEAGTAVVDWDVLDEADQRVLLGVFEERVAPLLEARTIQAGRPLRPPPGLALNLVVRSAARPAGVRRTTIVTIPGDLDRFEPLPGGRRWVPVEQLVAAGAGRLLGAAEVHACHSFRVMRAIGSGPVEATGDLVRAITATLGGRSGSAAIRLEVDRSMPSSLRGLLTRGLGLGPADVDVQPGPLGLADLGALAGPALAGPALAGVTRPGVTRPGVMRPGVTRPGVTRPGSARAWGRRPWPAQAPSVTRSGLFAALRAADLLLVHPYDTPGATVQALLEQAVDDPDVVAVKQTMYRAPTLDSPVVQALARSAEAGKETVVVVELRARLDEQANLACARFLEQAGAHVVYGVMERKTHARATLVLRREPGGVRPYCHIGTGNYDAVGAPPGEEAGLLSADPELGADLAQLFNLLTGAGRSQHYRRLLVAPGFLRRRLLALIAGQARPGGRIVIKVNGLADQRVIQALYDAARAGAEIDLVVRDICALYPGVPGLSDTIRVRSITGRYVDHTRIFRFGEPGPGASYYLGSADLLPEALDRRIDLLTPATDPAVRARLDEILAANLADDVLAWSLDPTGWSRVPTRLGVDAQQQLWDRAHRAGR